MTTYDVCQDHKLDIHNKSEGFINIMKVITRFYLAMLLMGKTTGVSPRNHQLQIEDDVKYRQMLVAGEFLSFIMKQQLLEDAEAFEIISQMVKEVRNGVRPIVKDYHGFPVNFAGKMPLHLSPQLILPSSFPSTISKLSHRSELPFWGGNTKTASGDSQEEDDKTAIDSVVKRSGTRTEEQERRIRELRRMLSKEYGNQHDDLFCTRVCNYCQVVLTLRWGALCRSQCGRGHVNKGSALDACITLWAMKYEAVLRKQYL